jgi:hypothetical protein
VCLLAICTSLVEKELLSSFSHLLIRHFVLIFWVLYMPWILISFWINSWEKFYPILNNMFMFLLLQIFLLYWEYRFYNPGLLLATQMLYHKSNVLSLKIFLLQSCLWFFLYMLSFRILLKKSLLMYIFWSISFMCSSSSFRVSGLTLQSFINFEFIFWTEWEIMI